jgi:hypothetical protein
MFYPVKISHLSVFNHKNITPIEPGPHRTYKCTPCTFNSLSNLAFLTILTKLREAFLPFDASKRRGCIDKILGKNISPKIKCKVWIL